MIKDAGDDPDVTHGAEIISALRPAKPGAGIIFHAGEGVGIVTLPGLPVAIGEAAINPAPRRMICEHLALYCQAHHHSDDWHVELSIPEGAEIAKKTWNPRLGIEGGLSILGTTGIVIPYSCSAWIDSIHRGIDVARATNTAHISACTGAVSEKTAARYFNLPLTSMIDMGDFAGGMLKYLRSHPVEKVTIAGGIAKITKLAQGHFDLHSSRSQVDFLKLADLAAHLQIGAVEKIKKSQSMGQVMNCLRMDEVRKKFFSVLARQARHNALSILSGDTKIDIFMVDREGIPWAWTGGKLKNV